MSHGNGCADGTRFQLHSPAAVGRRRPPSGMKREGYARSSAKRCCEFRALMISAHLDPAISPACPRAIPATIRNSTLLFPANTKNAPCSLDRENSLQHAEIIKKFDRKRPALPAITENLPAHRKLQGEPAARPFASDCIVSHASAGGSGPCLPNSITGCRKTVINPGLPATVLQALRPVCYSCGHDSRRYRRSDPAAPACRVGQIPRLVWGIRGWPRQ